MAGGRKTRRTDEAVAALLTEPTIADAASKCHISTRTLKRWLTLPSFKDRYTDAQRELLTAALNRLRTSGHDAVGVLRDVSQDTEAGSAARVAAARSLIELLLRGCAFDELEARLQKLEQALNEGRN